MNANELVRVLEPALHTLISERCQRAYLHDLRNGLQGIYGGFDALTRAVKGTTTVSPDRAAEFVRTAISGHEKSLYRIHSGMVLQESSVALVNVTVLIQELIKFLYNDASAHNVTLRAATSKELNVSVRASQFRLAILSLIIDAIDAMTGGGELQILSSAANEHVVIDFIEAPTSGEARSCVDPWRLDLSAEPLRIGLIMPVVQQLVIAENGTVECLSEKPGTRTLRIRLPAGLPA